MPEVARIVVWLASPLSIALLLGIGAIGLSRRAPQAAGRIALGAFLALWTGSLPVTAELLGAPLENYYAPIAVAAAPKSDVIVVLGGALVGAHPPGRPNIAMGSGADRVWQAAALFRAGKAPWIIATAGEREPEPGLQVESDAMVQMLQALGVPPENVRPENRSRTTRENAANSLALAQGLGAKRVLLVTSAQHLPRAVRTFKWAWANSGIEVIPFPADVTGTEPTTIWSFLPSADALRYVTRTLKEYAGIMSVAIMDKVTR